MQTEQRYFRAKVRNQGALGRFYRRDFCLTVEVQGSHDKLIAEAIQGITAKGYEVQNILSHSAKKDCL
ncbi:hypothetical protein Q9295_10220 [Xinfangfangia sp. CPCC 101601]|uniref:Uncharacterized protein n=1 Tax=Pseudogemmobacter lacusdianii TaxID=3069608 RepID=A0ABU0VYE3_9RHOB|nr:hypothetical protein [Xinfangfangia sp. CPCC 101601]MDQ2066753.1 hypothetical protein [Xinfangfangia sp. CPCC 101601]